VVNEPIVPWSKRDDGLYPGIWLNLLGPEYIEIAFHAAAAADPKALRVLNTYYVEQGTPDHEKGRRDNLRFLQQCKRRGVPIQAIGIESHLDASLPPGGPALRRFVDEVRALGLQVLITELDVNDSQVTGNLQDRGMSTG
jgi:endo-1,4-beta-xylanase